MNPLIPGTEPWPPVFLVKYVTNKATVAYMFGFLLIYIYISVLKKLIVKLLIFIALNLHWAL